MVAAVSAVTMAMEVMVGAQMSNCAAWTMGATGLALSTIAPVAEARNGVMGPRLRSERARRACLGQARAGQRAAGMSLCGPWNLELAQTWEQETPAASVSDSEMEMVSVMRLSM